MQRIMANIIEYCGCHYRNHIIELSDDGTVRIFPFRSEIHSTRFIGGHIRVTLAVDASGAPTLCVESIS